MKIMKFGGSSLSTPTRLTSVAQIILDASQEGEPIVVVVSAFEGVTDQLIKMGRIAAAGDNTYLEAVTLLEKRHSDAVKAVIPEGERQRCIVNNMKNSLSELSDILHGVFLLKELSSRTLDFIMSFGELFSAYVLSEIITEVGGDAEFLDARDLVKTDNSFGCARVYSERTDQNIKEYFDGRTRMQIATGFIASTFNNETTTLERGGSDYTASLFARALDATVIEIWTDVDGIMTADPKKVSGAFPVDAMTYEEAMEMSHFGAKVLHPPTMLPAVEKKIPIHIRNTFNPEARGSIITEMPPSSEYSIKGISSIDAVSLLRIHGGGMVGIAGIAMRIFNALSRKEINIILITQASSEHSICIAVRPEAALLAKREIEDEFSLEMYAHQIEEVLIEDDLSIVAVVGENMRRFPGIAGKVFAALGESGVNVTAIAQGSSELNISLVVKRSDEAKALNVIHSAFFLWEHKTANLFIVGTGLVGSALVSQIRCQREILKQNNHIDINIVALGDSKKMVFNEHGIDLIGWRDRLNFSPLEMDMEKFVKEMKRLNMRNAVFVDCTAEEDMVLSYDEILKASASLVTANKEGCTGRYDDYLGFKTCARKNGRRFLYETNVGAALPIIRTIKDLINSGDKILKIEAVLSGTLSYIFNMLDEKTAFSSLVRRAQEMGYAEPDPRNDLNCRDVAKKILILARESGATLEMEDVAVEALIAERYFETDSVDAFLEGIQGCDEIFEEKRKRAVTQGKKLRYIARYEKGKASLALQEVGEDHPFYRMSGNENIISFTTERYSECPLVIKGPGAGGEVTAAGVFADIMQVVDNN
jgi:bifunctional aspartokinase / homoserine dehydrogenase 1